MDSSLRMVMGSHTPFAACCARQGNRCICWLTRFGRGWQLRGMDMDNGQRLMMPRVEKWTLT